MRKANAVNGRMIAAALCCVALVVTTVLLQRDVRDAPSLHRVAYVLFPGSQILMVIVLFSWIIRFNLDASMFMLVCAITVICCPVDILLFRKLKQAQDKDLAEVRVQLLSEQLQIQARSNAQLRDDMVNIDRIRKDARSEFKRASELLASNEPCDVTLLFHGVQAVLASTPLRHCAHPVIDAVANVKYKECMAAGIEPVFALEVPDETPSIPDVEICAVFCNLLDNALAAAKRANECDSLAQPFVKVASSVHGNVLTIKMQNSMPGSLHFVGSVEQGDPQSMQGRFRRIQDHGWGLPIVEEIVGRHNGALVTNADHGVFTACATLTFKEAKAA